MRSGVLRYQTQDAAHLVKLPALALRTTNQASQNVTDLSLSQHQDCAAKLEQLDLPAWKYPPLEYSRPFFVKPLSHVVRFRLVVQTVASPQFIDVHATMLFGKTKE